MHFSLNVFLWIYKLDHCENGRDMLREFIMDSFFFLSRENEFIEIHYAKLFLQLKDSKISFAKNLKMQDFIRIIYSIF